MDKVLLVADTSGKQGSVGLVRASDGSMVRLLESVPLAGGTFSAQLVPQIASLLDKHGLGKKDLDGFIVISGPGSFTGLRVGLAAVKALAEILQKPIVAVSLLEVVALASETEGNIVAVLDASRGEVYTGEYEIRGGVARLRNEQLQSRTTFLSDVHGLVFSTTDVALAQMARDQKLTVRHVTVGAEDVARVGWRKLLAGEAVSPEQLEANYIRRSDAEIFSKPAASS